MIKFGFASQKITPEIGVQLAGFLGERRALGIHDDLFAKALYLNFSDKNKYIFIVLDTVAVFKEFSMKISESIEKESGIPREHIFISATHTHSGPEGLGSVHLPGVSEAVPVVGKDDEKLIEYTVHQTITTALKAISKNYEGKFEFAFVKFKEQVCGSRRVEGNENLMETKILLLRALSGEIVLAYNFGCHPTVLHEENLYISADFSGKVASVLAENINNLEFVVFFNGAAGDISTRFFRKESSFNEVNRIGTIIADNIKDSLPSLSELKFDEKHFNAKNIPISLRIKEFPSQESLDSMLKQAQSELENAKKEGVKNLRLYQSKIEGINSILASASFLANSKYLDTFIKIVLLDDLIFVGIPGEIFSTLGKQIEEGLKPRKVVLVGYCWDYIGYIPDIKAYEEGGYETLATLLEKGEGEKIVETVIKEAKSIAFK
jgi:hypothetical protein